MDAFYERLIIQAATIDEVLSDDFEALPGQKGETDLAAKRLAAWCRSCASGDWSLFGRRLARDGLAFADILTKFANARRKASAAPPAWIFDAIWIEASLQNSETVAPVLDIEPCAFEHLFMPLLRKASNSVVGSRCAGARQFGQIGTQLPVSFALKGTIQPCGARNL